MTWGEEMREAGWKRGKEGTEGSVERETDTERERGGRGKREEGGGGRENGPREPSGRWGKWRAG